MAGSQAETLQKLERLTHLETMVAEQRIRIEKYRTMYETIKTELVQVEDVKVRREKELNSLKEEIQMMQKRFQELLNQARMESDQRIQECEELRMQVLTPQKMEVMRMKLQEELETSYKQKLDTADLELDKYRSDFNKLRYEYSFLKSEYEHEQNKTRTMLEELRAQHQIEIDVLNKDKEDLIDQLRRQEDQNDAQRIRVLQKDNAQLNMKVKSLLDELDEIREKREATGLQSDHITRLQARQLSELSAHCKTLETEKDSFKMQFDRSQGELERASKQQELASHKIIKLERENLQLKSEMEELTHNHKVEMNNLKLILTKDKGELERERDTIESQLQTSKNKSTVLSQNLEELKQALTKKEEEIVRRVQDVKELEWEKISKLENYKLQADSQLADYERQKNDAEEIHKLQIEKFEDKIKVLADGKEETEKGLSAVRMQLAQQKQINEQLEESKRQNQELKGKQQKLLNDYERLKTIEEEMKGANEKQNDKIELLKRELQLSNDDMQKQREHFQRSMQETKRKLEGEKKEIDKDVKDLKQQLHDSKKLTLVAKKKTKKQKKLIDDLVKRLEIQRAQSIKMEEEKKHLTKNLNLEHERTKRALDRLRKKQNQFTNLLNVSAATVPDMGFGNMQQTPLLGMAFEPPREATSSKMRRELNDLSPVPGIDDILNDTSH